MIYSVNFCRTYHRVFTLNCFFLHGMARFYGGSMTCLVPWGIHRTPNSHIFQGKTSLSLHFQISRKSIFSFGSSFLLPKLT